MNALKSLMQPTLKMILGFMAVVPLAWAIYFFGIYLGYENWKVRGHQEFARNGIAQIQPAAEMDELFEDCRHYIVYSGKDSVSTWNTTAYFGGRYELTMQVPVAIRSADSGSVIDAPGFFLNEVEAVTISSSGQVGASYSDNLNFGPSRWKKVYESGGDFETIGFTLKTKPVPDFRKFADGCRPSN